MHQSAAVWLKHATRRGCRMFRHAAADARTSRNHFLTLQQSTCSLHGEGGGGGGQVCVSLPLPLDAFLFQNHLCEEKSGSRTWNDELHIILKWDESSRLMVQETDVCPDHASSKRESQWADDFNGMSEVWPSSIPLSFITDKRCALLYTRVYKMHVDLIIWFSFNALIFSRQLRLRKLRRHIRLILAGVEKWIMDRLGCGCPDLLMEVVGNKERSEARQEMLRLGNGAIHGPITQLCTTQREDGEEGLPHWWDMRGWGWTGERGGRVKTVGGGCRRH